MIASHIMRGAAAARYEVNMIREWSDRDEEFVSRWRVSRGLIVIGDYPSAEEAETIVTLLRTPEYPMSASGPVDKWIRSGGPEAEIRCLARMGIALEAETMIKYVKERARAVARGEEREIGPAAGEG